MNKNPLVNFHCHSIYSDGVLTPESLVENLAATGVRFASLTDHDTIEGLPRFQKALGKRGITFLPGVEITAQYSGREIHLLAYGFDTENAELRATLLSLRQARGSELHSIADSLRKAGNNHQNTSGSNQAISATIQGSLDVEDAITLIHRAGGRVFWAHPLKTESNLDMLEILLRTFKSMGLDGLEAVYASFSSSEQIVCEN